MSFDSDPSDTPPPAGRIGLVLAGGGARGAYEAGVLSVLLPRLAADGERPSVIVGTSVGALNGSWVAANAHRPVQDLVAGHRELWRTLRWEDVLGRLLSIRSLVPAARYLARALGAGVRLESLLDARPLGRTVQERLDVRQLNANVRSRRLRAAAVVATSAVSGRSVVFHAGGGRVRRDDLRGIDYVPVPLAAEHVLASAAIPTAFRAVRVRSPRDVAGWYVDGGTRLNTPIKPALALGARRVIVVGLNTVVPPPDGDRDGACPDVFHGLGHITQAVLADPLIHDARTLATINELAKAHGDGRHRVVPYMLITPRHRDRIGEIASEVFRDNYRDTRALRTSVGLLGRLTRAVDDPANGELLSYLFFAPEFAEALIAEGAADAGAWVRERHDDGFWQHGPLTRGRAGAVRVGSGTRGSSA